MSEGEPEVVDAVHELAVSVGVEFLCGVDVDAVGPHLDVVKLEAGLEHVLEELES